MKFNYFKLNCVLIKMIFLFVYCLFVANQTIIKLSGVICVILNNFDAYNCIIVYMNTELQILSIEIKNLLNDVTVDATAYNRP